MNHVIITFLSYALVFGSGVRAAIPVDLVGEWRQRPYRGAYNGIYIHRDGRAGFIAAGDDGQINAGGGGIATYESFRRTLTLSFPDSPRKVFRFAHDPQRETLTMQSEPNSRPFKRHSEKIPLWIERLRQ